MDNWLKTGSLKRKPSYDNKPSRETDVDKASSTKRKISNIRKHDECYLAFGFISDGGSALTTQCLLCYKNLNSSMVPVKLQRYFEAQHSE